MLFANEQEMKIYDLQKSIIELSESKSKLLREVNDINETIFLLRQQQQELV